MRPPDNTTASPCSDILDHVSFRSLFEHNQSVMLLIEPEEGRIIEANPAAAAFYGYSRELLCSMRTSQINVLPPEEIAEKRRQARLGLQNLFEFPHRMADGSVRVVEVRSSPVTVDGRIMLFSVVQDVTDSRRTEAALHAKTEELNRYFTSSLDLLCIASTTGRFLRLNPEWERVLGYSLTELEGRNYLDLVHPEDHQATMAAISSLDAQKEVLRFVNRYRCRDGSFRWIEWNARPDGTQVYAAARDITDRKRAESELLEVERRLHQAQKLESLGVLAGGIAHDFNNLLLAMQGNVELARLELPADSGSRELLDQALMAVRNASELTRQMLAFSGKGTVEKRLLSLNEIVERRIQLLRSCLPSRVAVELGLEASLPVIRADTEQVEQLIFNLVSNAAEAIGESAGKVCVGTQARYVSEVELRGSRTRDTPPSGRYVELSITDDGCGMDESAQLRLFDPFFTTKFLGRGLGMASTLGIVRSHGGAILVESKPGVGTSIRILFPAVMESRSATSVAGPGQREPGQPDGQDDPGAGTVLVIDDDDAVRQVCGRLLRRHGWTVLTAEDGPSGLELYGRHREEIGCTLLDLSMPGMDGLEVYRRLCRINPDARVILSTGYNGDQEAARRFVEEGGAGFLQKPYMADALLAELHRVARRPKTVR